MFPSAENQPAFNALFQQAMTPMALSLMDGTIVQVNSAFCEFLGYSEAELLNKKVWEITCPEDQGLTREQFDRGQNSSSQETRYVRKDGSAVCGCTTLTWVRDPSGKPVYGVLLIENRGALQTSENVRIREELYRTLFEKVDIGISMIDSRHQFLMVNPTLARWHNTTVEELVGKYCYREAAKRSDPCPDCPGVRALQTGTPQSLATETIENGQRLNVHIKAFPVLNSEGIADRFIEIVENITDQIVVGERIHHLAFYDQLTDLPNRTLFMDRLENALARCRRTDEQIALLFVDLDRFKNINDSYGHQVGDKILKVIGKKLRTKLRESDTLARFGGDEFIILAEKFKGPAALEVVAGKILAVLQEPVTVGSRTFYLSGTIGISIFPQDGRSAEILVRRADSAMYRAKEEGGSEVRFYSPEVEQRCHQFLKLDSHLRSAVQRDEFLLYYQPQLDLLSKETLAFESLIRWQHPTLGMVPPADFIPLAEETGMIIPIGTWALEAACRQAKEWLAAGTPAKVAVNISLFQFQRGNLAATIENLLQTTGVPSHLLELEVTESMVMKNVERAIRMMHELVDLGISLAIDDFGTGYSSLAYLKRFPIRRLKIDRSFVKDIPADANSAAIVNAIVNLAKSMGLEVMAEGIETEAQMEFLLERGCVQGQGFLFGPPAPANDLGKYLGRSLRSAC